MGVFKAKLAECRSFAASEPDDGWRDLVLAVLDRWQAEPDVDKAWDTILRAATSGGREALSPIPLIEWAIDQAILYKRLCNEVVPKSDNLEKRAISAAEKEWKHGTNLEWAAATKKSAQQHRSDRIRILGRQPRLAPQKRLINLCREMLVEKCGQPLDQVNELLTSVIVGQEIKPNAIRDALKPSTRAGRDTKHQK
ncbi:MAG: hypothetical protein ABI192_15790 [Bradyrhizobium sp.]